jgi:hypothetical protein
MKLIAHMQFYELRLRLASTDAPELVRVSVLAIPGRPA